MRGGLRPGAVGLVQQPAGARTQHPPTSAHTAWRFSRPAPLPMPLGTLGAPSQSRLLPKHRPPINHCSSPPTNQLLITNNCQLTSWSRTQACTTSAIRFLASPLSPPPAVLLPPSHSSHAYLRQHAAQIDSNAALTMKPDTLVYSSCKHPVLFSEPHTSLSVCCAGSSWRLEIAATETQPTHHSTSANSCCSAAASSPAALTATASFSAFSLPAHTSAGMQLAHAALLPSSLH